ncbi:ABC transporter substrate-binding protein [soil metagenome]
MKKQIYGNLLCVTVVLAALILAACAGAVQPAAAPAPTTAATEAMTTTETMTSTEAMTDTGTMTSTEAMTDTGTMTATGTSTETSAVPAGDMDALIAAAKQEGSLNTIALPRDWCNYGEVLDSFKSKYGIEINELNPDGGSGDEIEAIKANKDNKGPQAPDVIDVGFPFGGSSKDEGLIQPYKVSTWDSIPTEVKDADGYWYGDYFGVLAFMVNTDVVKDVPQDWADLLKPDYASAIGLSGDPRTSNQAIQSVFAATLSNGGSLDDAAKGLEFFAELNKAGNLVPVISNNALVAKGETPVRVTWDYLALSGKDQMNGNPPIEVVIPKTGRFGGVYVQAISAYAPHPNAAKLWMEHLYSDEGQVMWLKGYCHPIRQADLEKRNVIPADLLAKLPSVEGAVFPSVKQLDDAKKLITENWDKEIGADIKAAQ